MSQRTRNLLIVLAGLVLLGVVIGSIQRKADTAERAAPAARPLLLPAKPAKIFRMEAALEELRKLPVIDGMARADDVAWRALPRGVEVSGEWVRQEDVLEGYAHPNGRRFFIIMKPGDRAYSVFLDAAD